MKKILSSILILLMMICITGNVIAELSCNVSLQTERTEYKKNEEIGVNVNLSNIQTDNGIIAFSATLNYDKDSLVLSKMEGQNDWSNPLFNENNGKFVMERSDPTTNNETMLTIFFTVRENAKQNLTITLNNVSLANGYDTQVEISSVSKDISIKTETVNTIQNTNTTNPTNKVTPSEATDTTQPEPVNTTNTPKPIKSTNTVKPSKTEDISKQTGANNSNNSNQTILSSIANKVLPHTGKTSMVIVLLMIMILTIFAINSYIKIKSIDKKEQTKK